MRKKGFPVLRGSSRGDQLVRIHVETPSGLNKKQKSLFEELESKENQIKNPYRKIKL